MIEKIKLDSLNFKEIVIKEDVEKVSLKEVFDKILPLFEKSYKISKKYDTRSKFSEDEDYINTRIEIGEILLLLRKSYKNFGLSEEDQEFLKELNLRWERFIRDFPVFNEEVERLFTFWFLSYLDVLEIPFDSDFKTTSFVDLFFFEKIIDYIVSEKGEEKISEEDILEKFQRFTSPIDHYRAILLILQNLKLEGELKQMLLDGIEKLHKKIKNKISDQSFFVEKVNVYLKQESYDKTKEFFLKRGEIFLKNDPLFYFSLYKKIKDFYGDENFLVEYFNDVNRIKNIMGLVDNSRKTILILQILLKVKITNSETKKFLLDSVEKVWKFSETIMDVSEIVSVIGIYIKEEDLKKAVEIFNSYEIYVLNYDPTAYLRFLIKFFLNSVINIEEHLKYEIMVKILYYARFLKEEENRHFFVIWEFLSLFNYPLELVNIFLESLSLFKLKENTILFKEKQCLYEYLKTLKKEDNKFCKFVFDLNIKGEKFFFSEGNIIDFSKKVEKRTVEKISHISKSKNSILVTPLDNYLVKYYYKTEEMETLLPEERMEEYIFLNSVEKNNQIFVIGIKKESFRKKWIENIGKLELLSFNIINKTLVLEEKLKIGKYLRAISISEDDSIALLDIGDEVKKIYILNTRFEILDILYENEITPSLKFKFPLDFRFLNDKDIYILDMGNSTLFGLNIDSKKLFFTKEIAEYTIRSFDFDSKGNLYVSSFYNNVVYKFNKEGEILGRGKIPFQNIDGVIIVENLIFIHNIKNGKIFRGLLEEA